MIRQRTNVNRVSFVRSCRGIPRNSWTPTDQDPAPGDSNVRSTKPASWNHARMRGVRSGRRRCRVQTTEARRAHSWGIAPMILATSASETFPNTPQTSTRSAGTAPTYASVTAASQATTSIESSPACSTLSRALWARCEFCSTRRALILPQCGSREIAPSRSRPSPAQILTARTSVPPRARRTSPIARRTTTSRWERVLRGSS